MTFTIFDITTISIILLSSFLGLYKGMINILIGLLAFITSIVGAIWLYPHSKGAFAGHIHNELVITISSGITAYIIALVIVTFFSSKVVTFFSGQSGGMFDRIVGLGIGFIRGYFIAMVIFAIMAVLASGSYVEAKDAKSVITDLKEDEYPEWLKESKVTPYLEMSAKIVVIQIPDEWLESIKIPKDIDPKNADEIIDSINKKHNGVKSSIEMISSPASQSDKAKSGGE